MAANFSTLLAHSDRRPFAELVRVLPNNSAELVFREPVRLSQNIDNELQALLAQAFQTHQVERITAFVDSSESAALRLLNRVAFSSSARSGAIHPASRSRSLWCMSSHESAGAIAARRRQGEGLDSRFEASAPGCGCIPAPALLCRHNDTNRLRIRILGLPVRKLLATHNIVISLNALDPMQATDYSKLYCLALRLQKVAPTHPHRP